MSNNVIVTGNIRKPKWGNLKELHKVIKLCEPTLVYGDVNIISLGRGLQVFPSIDFFMYKMIENSIPYNPLFLARE